MREYFYVVTYFEGAPLLIKKPYMDSREAEQAAARETSSGAYKIVSFPTRDKREIERLWRVKIQNGEYS
jgi:hypothetical protein